MIIKTGEDYIPQVKELILDYIQRLGRDLSFQNLNAELSDLESKYLPPNGEILVAIDDDEVLGWLHTTSMMM